MTMMSLLLLVTIKAALRLSAARDARTAATLLDSHRARGLCLCLPFSPPPKEERKKRKSNS